MDAQITIDDMRHAVVGGKTYNGYKYEIWKILQHGRANHHTLSWLTQPTVDRLDQIDAELGTIVRQKLRRRRKWELLKSLLMQCEEAPILDIPKLTPESYMEFLQAQRNPDGSLLKAKAYASKTSALHHLFCCHGGLEGYPDGFEARLKTLKTGLLRRVTTIRADEGEDGDGDGKKAMNAELYLCLARWFFEMGNAEGLFAHCFLVLSWNLMCRSNNTCRICLSHMSWDWDSLVIRFAQQKGDQMGLTERFPRHLYANPTNFMVCPLFVLGAYLTTFDSNVEPTSKLFPGPSQAKHFSETMEKVLKAHEEEVRAMGYSGGNSDIGTHSIRKGATKFVSGQPGGPSAMSICIRGGWSLGGVKDVYMTYQAEGDAFCGRMLSMLPLLQAEFASSPYTFDAPVVPDAELQAHRAAHPNGIVLSDVVGLSGGVFESFIGANHESLGRGLLNRCLAALAFHKDKVMALPLIHHLRQNVILFTDAHIMECFAGNVTVIQPWDSGLNDGNLKFGSGIPPHVALQVCQQAMIRDLEKFVSGFDETMNRIFDEQNVQAGGISEGRMRSIVQEVRTGFEETVRQQLAAEIRRYGLGGAVQQPQHAADDQGGPNQNPMNTGYTLHFYGGKFHRVPQGWRFPSCGIRQLWIKWHIGDSVNNIPPLRSLNGADVKHLDALPNPNNQKRRLARKILADIRIVCTYIDRIADVNNWNAVGKPRDDLIQFFDNVATTENGLISSNARAPHTQWRTAVHAIAAAKKRASNAAAATQ